MFCIHSGSYSSSEFNGNGYSSDRVRPYGSPSPVDIPANSPNNFNPQGYNGYGYDASYDSHGSDWNQNGYGYGNIWTEKMNVMFQQFVFFYFICLRHISIDFNFHVK